MTPLEKRARAREIIDRRLRTATEIDHDLWEVLNILYELEAGGANPDSVPTRRCTPQPFASANVDIVVKPKK